MGRGRRQVDRGGDLLIGQPSILLQQGENGEVRSVEIGVLIHVPPIIRWLWLSNVYYSSSSPNRQTYIAMPYIFDHLPAISEQQRAQFDAQGFLIVERLLDSAQIEALRQSFPRLFAGEFDTGIYPDEWYWREG